MLLRYMVGLIAVVGLALGSGAWVAAQDNAPAPAEQPARAALGEVAPDFTLTSMNLIEQFREAGHEVVWLGINSSHFSTHEHNAERARQHNVSFPVLNDPTGRVGRLYNATRTPEMFVLCADQKVRYHGAIDSDRNVINRAADASVTNYVAEAVRALASGDEVATTHVRPYGCTVKYAE